MPINIRPSSDSPPQVDLSEQSLDDKSPAGRTPPLQHGGPVEATAQPGPGQGVAEATASQSFGGPMQEGPAQANGARWGSGMATATGATVLPTGSEPAGRASPKAPPATPATADGRANATANTAQPAPAGLAGAAAKALQNVTKAANPNAISLQDWKTLAAALPGMTKDQQSGVKAQLNKAFPASGGMVNGGGDMLQYAADGMAKGDVNAAQNRLREMQGKS